MPKAKGSPAHSINWEEVYKVARAFAYNAVSLTAAIVFALTQVPADQVPQELLWIVSLAPVINAIAYAVVQWKSDNR